MSALVRVEHPVPEVFAPILERLRAEDAVFHGGARLVPVSHQDRPFSHVMRVAAHHGDAAEPSTHLYVKVFKAAPDRVEAMRQRVAGEYATTSRIYDAMRESSELGVVRPVACYPEWLALVTEEAKGVTLQDFLIERASWNAGPAGLAEAEEAAARVGRWIRAFQATARSEGSVSIADLEAYIDHRLQRLTQHTASKLTADDRTRLLRHIADLGRGISPPELQTVPVHSDMALGNVLVSGGRVVVLDFAMAKDGTALHDVARVYVQIGLLGIKPLVRASAIARIQAALLRGFDPALTPERPLFRLLALLHHVNHFTTVTVRPAGWRSALYHRFVRRHHRQWLLRELASARSAS